MSLLHPGRGAKYCDEHVCLSVCVSMHISGTIYLHVASAACIACSHGSILIHYVLPVLSMTLCFPLMGLMVVWCYCSSLTAVLWTARTPLLRGIGCFLSNMMAGAKTRQVFRGGLPGQSVQCSVASFWSWSCNWRVIERVFVYRS